MTKYQIIRMFGEYFRGFNYQKLAIFELIFVNILFGIPEEFILLDSQLLNTLIISIAIYVISMIIVDKKSKNDKDTFQL